MVGVSDTVEEMEDRSGVARDAEIWPGYIVELVDLPHLLGHTGDN